MRNMQFSKTAALVFTSLAAGTLIAMGADDPLKIPSNFKQWYFVNSMLITKDQNKFGLVAGNHLIYISPKGVGRLKRNGSTPYPDGTIFVDDVRNYSADDGAYLEANRKFLTVMIKGSKKYASTGGWGFQAWADGDPGKPIVTDSVKQCFACHASQKAHDFVFSSYID